MTSATIEYFEQIQCQCDAWFESLVLCCLHNKQVNNRKWVQNNKRNTSKSTRTLWFRWYSNPGPLACEASVITTYYGTCADMCKRCKDMLQIRTMYKQPNNQLETEQKYYD